MNSAKITYFNIMVHTNIGCDVGAIADTGMRSYNAIRPDRNRIAKLGIRAYHCASSQIN
jgi:hypothetical protein